MPLDAKAYLADVLVAADRISMFVSDTTFQEYAANDMMRSAVERQFEIIGEALRKLSAVDGKMAAQIPEARRIIAFRNVLVHGYASVDNRLVWEIAEGKLRGLRATVASLLDGA